MGRYIRVSIYRCHALNSTWHAAAWIDGEYDGCEELAAAIEKEARAEIAAWGFDAALIERVSDVDANGQAVR